MASQKKLLCLGIGALALQACGHQSTATQQRRNAIASNHDSQTPMGDNGDAHDDASSAAARPGNDDGKSAGVETSVTKSDPPPPPVPDPAPMPPVQIPAPMPIPPGSLPEGNLGLAAKYPHDAGLCSDPAVIFCEDFEEDSVNSLLSRWEDHDNVTTFSTDVPSGSGGKQSLLLKATSGQDSGGYLYRRIAGQDMVYLRYYVKIASDSHALHHGPMWIGGMNPSLAYPYPKAGQKPLGSERFATASEPYNWLWDFYTYWQDMRGNPAGPQFWGNSFVSDSTWTVTRGQWVCVEQMVKMNAPVTDSNGEQALWVNGQLRRGNGQVTSYLGKGFPRGNWVWDSFHPDPNGTPFEGYQWRTTTALNINYIWPQLYITDSPAGAVDKLWFDDLVVAKQYIGCLP